MIRCSLRYPAALDQIQFKHWQSLKIPAPQLNSQTEAGRQQLKNSNYEENRKLHSKTAYTPVKIVSSGGITEAQAIERQKGGERADLGTGGLSLIRRKVPIGGERRRGHNKTRTETRANGQRLAREDDQTSRAALPQEKASLQ